MKRTNQKSISAHALLPPRCPLPLGSCSSPSTPLTGQTLRALPAVAELQLPAGGACACALRAAGGMSALRWTRSAAGLGRVLRSPGPHRPPSEEGKGVSDPGL
jgi:hypothetical protein